MMSMSEDLVSSILRDYIRSLHLAVYSYLKPGSLHRFAPTGECEVLFECCSIIVPQLSSIIRKSLMIGRGGATIPSIEVGNAIAEALREARLVAHTVPHHVVTASIIMVSSVAYAHSQKRPPDLSTIRSSQIQILRGSTWRDAANFIRALQTYCPEVQSTLDDLELSEHRIEYEDMNLEDVLSILSTKIKPYYYLLERSAQPLRAAEVFGKEYEISGDAFKSAIVTYLELLAEECEFREIVDFITHLDRRLPLRSLNKELYRLDQELRRRGVMYHHLIVPLFMGIFMYLSTR